MNMFPQTEVVCIQVQVLLEVSVVHEVWEVSRDGEVAVTGHLLARVDAARVVETRVLVVGVRVFVMPQSP